MERELAFSDAYLTWNEEAQGFEDALREAHAAADGDVDGLRRRLDAVQDKMDVASLNGEEWNVLYRLRLPECEAVSTPGAQATNAPDGPGGTPRRDSRGRRR